MRTGGTKHERGVLLMHGALHSHEHFELHDISKIEGHASLTVDLKGKKVESVKFRVSENNRFFEQMVLGKSYKELPLIVGRICGFCSSAHLLAALEATENAFGVELGEQNHKLRELLLNGEFIKSHALHLFFLALPDYLGKQSVLEFDKKQMKLIETALALKKVGTEIVETVGGRSYHDLRLRVGGFFLLPNQKKLEHLYRDLLEAKKQALEALELFAGYREKFCFERKTNYIALAGKNYCLLCGTLASSTGATIKEENYSLYFKEFVVPYSTSTQVSFEGKEYMVGALARINLNQGELCKSARDKIRELKLEFPSDSRYFNNIAQSIELLQCIESSIEIVNSFNLVKETPAQIVPRNTVGIGVIEAPRGTLYHQYKFDSNGFVKEANIIVPTSQNTHNIERDIELLLPELIEKKKHKHAIEHEFEKLIRAYDPCISCATHFLKVNWNQR